MYYIPDVKLKNLVEESKSLVRSNLEIFGYCKLCSPCRRVDNKHLEAHGVIAVD